MKHSWCFDLLCVLEMLLLHRDVVEGLSFTFSSRHLRGKKNFSLLRLEKGKKHKLCTEDQERLKKR